MACLLSSSTPQPHSTPPVSFRWSHFDASRKPYFQNNPYPEGPHLISGVWWGVGWGETCTLISSPLYNLFSTATDYLSLPGTYRVYLDAHQVPSPLCPSNSSRHTSNKLFAQNPSYWLGKKQTYFSLPNCWRENMPQLSNSSLQRQFLPQLLQPCYS